MRSLSTTKKGLLPQRAWCTPRPSPKKRPELHEHSLSVSIAACHCWNLTGDDSAAIIARRIAAEREGSTKTRYLLVETWVGASPNSVFQTSHGISR